MISLVASGSETEYTVSLENAIARCGLFQDLEADIREEAANGKAVVEVQGTVRGLKFVSEWLSQTDVPQPASGTSWADFEVETTCPELVHRCSGSQRIDEPGSAFNILEGMAAADYVRCEALLQYLANFVAGALSKATPVEVKRWCGFTGPLSTDEQTAVFHIHQSMVDRRL